VPGRIAELEPGQEDHRPHGPVGGTGGPLPEEGEPSLGPARIEAPPLGSIGEQRRIDGDGRRARTGGTVRSWHGPTIRPARQPDNRARADPGADQWQPIE
jgi:hypothetical protein